MRALDLSTIAVPDSDFARWDIQHGAGRRILYQNVAETPTEYEKQSLDSARDFCELVCGVALGEGSQHATQFAVWFV